VCAVCIYIKAGIETPRSSMGSALFTRPHISGLCFREGSSAAPLYL
jgi:hypothetical protein